MKHHIHTIVLLQLDDRCTLYPLVCTIPGLIQAKQPGFSHSKQNCFLYCFVHTVLYAVDEGQGGAMSCNQIIEYATYCSRLNRLYQQFSNEPLQLSSFCLMTNCIPEVL